MSKTYKSYLLAVLCFTVLAIVLMPLLYFTTAWSIAGFASIATFIFYKEYFYEEKKNCYLRQQVTVSST
ncbi:TPA: DUF1270 domain-containing protein [Staphylococcus aureus]|nr:DUF1270 domain-containing protein [Staphylococcus aureus]